MFVELTKEYLTGNSEIDAQHLRLCELINTLHDDIENRISLEKLKSSLEFLSNYTHQHFTYELKVLSDINYPELEEHTIEHAELSQKLAKMGENFIYSVNMNREDRFAIEFLSFLKDWLLNHIMQDDMKYVPYLNEK